MLNHVLLHQTVIGQEAMEQMAMAGEKPDILIACTGGGSNFAGLTFPFIGQKLRGEADYRFIAAEPAAAPSLTRGIYAYDFGDTGKMAPVVKMHTLGHDFVPDPIHAGGLRYHGMAPQVSLLKDQGIIEARAVVQSRTFEAGAASSRRPRASCPRRSRRTPSASSSTRRARPRRRARARSSSSTCAATATSTSPRTSASWPASWRTTSCPRSASSTPWRPSLPSSARQAPCPATLAGGRPRWP